MASKIKRERSLWLRGSTSRELHAIVGTFDRHRVSADLTDRQEWLYDRIVQELERRHKGEKRLLARCWCRYCVSPFPGDT